MKQHVGARRKGSAGRFGSGLVLAALALLLVLSACAKTPTAPPAAQETPSIQAQEPENPVPELPEEEHKEESEEVTEESVSPADGPAQSAEAQEDPPPTADEPEQPPEDADDWKLILVNADHPVPEDYEVTLKELRNDQWVDERIYPELQQMFDDARAEGIYPLINESFRSDERQQEILDSYTAAYVDSGMSEAEALEQTLTVVAVPGTSEHQLGLALDIISETDEDDTATWQWLRENAWRYGFILRYPEDKTEITGISYEPWHYRYVGKEAALIITEQGITLEEYLEEDE